MSKTTAFFLVFVGVVIGYAWSYQANALQPTKIYEDGSYYGCMKDYPCNDQINKGATAMTRLELENAILELIESRDEIPYSDMQGIVMALATKAIEEPIV